MKAIAFLLVAVATSVFAEDADEPFAMSASQRLFIVHRLIEMQTTIDDQEKELKELKEKLGCA